MAFFEWDCNRVKQLEDTVLDKSVGVADVKEQLISTVVLARQKGNPRDHLVQPRSPNRVTWKHCGVVPRSPQVEGRPHFKVVDVLLVKALPYRPLLHGDGVAKLGYPYQFEVDKSRSCGVFLIQHVEDRARCGCGGLHDDLLRERAYYRRQGEAVDRDTRNMKLWSPNLVDKILRLVYEDDRLRTLSEVLELGLCLLGDGPKGVVEKCVIDRGGKLAVEPAKRDRAGVKLRKRLILLAQRVYHQRKRLVRGLRVERQRITHNCLMDVGE